MGLFLTIFLLKYSERICKSINALNVDTVNDARTGLKYRPILALWSSQPSHTLASLRLRTLPHDNSILRS